MNRAPRASLTEAAVRSIRRRHTQGEASVKDLAREYGLGAETIRRILRWETWAWVGEAGPGAPAEAWAPRPEDLAASQARLLALASGAPTGAGLARLQQEAAVAGRGGRLVDELAGQGNVDGVESKK